MIHDSRVDFMSWHYERESESWFDSDNNAVDIIKYAPKIRITLKMRAQLQLGHGVNNSKLLALALATGMKTSTLDIPAGWTCPTAHICQSRTDKVTGHVTLGNNARFMCYAARTESTFPSTRAMRWKNLDFIRAALHADSTGESLAQTLTRDYQILNPGIVRIHSSGDVFNPSYARAIIRTAELNPDILFFGYTKVYSAYQMINGVNYSNLGFAFSIGSKDDSLVHDSDVTCTVLESEEMTQAFPYDVICGDHKNPWDYSLDFHYIMARQSFGIPLH